MIAAILLLTVGIVASQVDDSSNAIDGEGNSESISQANVNKSVLETENMVEGDPEQAARNEKLDQELIEHISQIKDLIKQGQYTEALTLVDEFKLEIDTTNLKAEIKALTIEERELKKKQAEERAMSLERLAKLEETQKQQLVEAEKAATEAKLIWQKEAATERDMLRLANSQKEKVLNFMATNQPQVKIAKTSEDGSMWEAKVVLKRPENKPKEFTLKFNKNKLLESNKDAIVNVIGPHIERVGGKKQERWQLVVKDAFLEERLDNFNHLVNEQKKILFMKEQSIRKKYPQLGKYFPQ
jgi:hypothetical protein